MDSGLGRGLHRLLDERDVSVVLQRVLGRTPVAMQQYAAIPPRVIYEASFTDAPAVIFKAEVTLPGHGHDIALEGWALQQAKRAGLPVPDVLAQDSSEREFPFRYLVMTRLEGASLEATPLPPERLAPLLAEAGALVVRLHDIEIAGYGWLDEELYLATGEVRGVDSDWRAATVDAGRETLRRLVAAGVVSPDAAAALDEKLATAPVPRQPAGRLMNGDFDSTQIFVRSDGSLSGLIDFGDRESGPREWEFATVLLWDEPLLEGLLAGYEGALGRRLDRDLIPVYKVAKLLQILQRRLDRGPIDDAREKAQDLYRFV